MSFDYACAVETLGAIEWFDGVKRPDGAHPDGAALFAVDWWRRTLLVPFKRNARRYGR